MAVLGRVLGWSGGGFPITIFHLVVETSPMCAFFVFVFWLWSGEGDVDEGGSVVAGSHTPGGLVSGGLAFWRVT